MSRELAPSTRLRGRWLTIARVLWLAFVIPALGLFVVAVAIYVIDFPRHVPPAVRADLVQLGLTDERSSVYLLVISLIQALIFFIVGLGIFWRRSDDWIAILASFMLIMVGASRYEVSAVYKMGSPVLYRLIIFVSACGFGAANIFAYLFPDGRFVPSWTRLVAIGVVIIELVGALFGEAALYGMEWIWTALLVIWVGAQIYRYYYISGPLQRQQTKWVVFGFTLASLVYGLSIYLLIPLSRTSDPAQSLYFMLGYFMIRLAHFCLPITIGIAILRYRLWDIDLVINRTLVYTTLTASVIALYVLSVSALGTLFQARGTFAVSMLATGMVAVLFEPLRFRLQRSANRLMYGERDDPYAVLARLGQRLEATLSPQAVLPAIVETLAQALKLPYVGILLKQGELLVIAAEYPSRQIGWPGNQGLERKEPEVQDDAHPVTLSFDHLIRLPLTYQGEDIGELRVAPRAPGEAFSPGDRRLLDDLAPQVGIAAYAVRLTDDLQRSRERIVTAREEERRRLRRDLHDGLGPALAAQTLKLGSARLLYPRDPARADALLAELERDIAAALADIRRLVYALRPPALDDLGLVGALRELAQRQFAESNGLHISVEAPAQLPPLPAAVEVAAYRITQEALTNVIRHAQAHQCRVLLTLDERLQLEILDDGVGLPPDRRAGVGLASMRERAAELGGMCVVEPGNAGGTCVLAHLPLRLP